MRHGQARTLCQVTSFALLLCFFRIHIANAQESNTDRRLLAILTLSERWNSAYESRDLAAVARLWSAQSPQLPAIREQAEKLFASGLVARIVQTTVGTPELAGPIGRIRIRREVTDGGSHPRVNQLVLECVEEANEWKIVKETSATDDLANRLSEAVTEEQRNSILSRNQDLTDTELVAALNSRGSDLRHTGQATRALPLYVLASTLAERVGDGKGQALAWSNIGLVHAEHAEFAEAMLWFGKSREKSESLGDETGIARVLNNAGATLSDIGDLPAARANYERSLAISERLGNSRLIGLALGNLGTLYGREGDYLNALTMLDRSSAADEKSGNIAGRAIAKLNIGNLFAYQGDEAEAAHHFEDVLQIAHKLGNKGLEASALLGLGRNAEFQGDFAAAVKHLAAALAIAEEIGDRLHVAVALTYLGDTYSWMNQPEKALDYFRRGVEEQRELGATSNIVTSLALMAAAQEKAGDHEAAITTARNAQEEGERLGASDVVWRARVVAGDAYLQLHQLAKAKQEFAAAVDLIEQVRQNVGGSEPERERYLANNITPYHRLLEISAKQHAVDDVFSYAERTKARVLVDVFQGAREELERKMTTEEQHQDRNLRLQLASLNSKVSSERQTTNDITPILRDDVLALRKARLEYGSFQATLYAQHPDWRSKVGQITPISVAEAAHLLPSRSALVEFTVTEHTLYTLVIASDKDHPSLPPKLFSSPVERVQLTAQIQHVRKLLENRSPGIRGVSAVLYRELLAPLRSAIAHKQMLVIVPDGPIWDVPFYALPTSEGGYFLDRVTLSYAPSATSLKEMTSLRRQRRGDHAATEFLAMANPSAGGETRRRVTSIYRNVEYASLPSTETEVNQIQKMYGVAHSRIYIGPDARESLFKQQAPAARVIHLATHATLDDTNPLYSHLLLAAEKSGSSEDGILEAWELMQLDLHAELAVLSACGTARGTVAPGEGVIGLSWALFVAGVPTVVVSQWKVQSESTSALMVEFHRNRRRGLSDAEALRLASLAVRRNPDYQHPFYWAPFIVVGAAF